MAEPPSVREIRLPAPHPRFRARVSGAGRQATHPGAAVQFGDDLYEIVSARAENGAWIYRLEPWDPGQVTRLCLPWGEEAEQEFFGRYHPRPYVLLSIGFNFLLAVSMILTDAGRIGLGYFGWWIGLRLVFGAALLGESVIRLLRHLSRGEISGSFLGVFVKPIYLMAMRGGPDETVPR